MSNIITSNVNSLLNPDKKAVSGNDLTGVLKAKQEADQSALGVHKQPPTDDFMPSARGMQAAAMGTSFEQSYAYSQTMSLQLTTKEGDQVKVDFRQLYAEYQSYKQTQSAEQGPQGARYFESREAMEATAFEERFGFSVEGDLNENELKAVFNVFEQVDQLANEFYNGDIEKAFEKAQDLKVDFGQLQSISLDMSKAEMKTTTYQQVAAYQQTQNTTETEGEAQEANIADLPPYLQKWQAAMETLDQFFENARGAFDDMMSGALAQRFPDQGSQSSWFDRVSSFHDQLAEMANLDKVTLKPSGVELTPPEEEVTLASVSDPLKASE